MHLRFHRPSPIAHAPAVLALALLAACGGEPSGSSGAAVATDHDTYSGGPPGGVVVVLMDGEPDELNPLTYESSPAFQAIRLMFRGLARRDSTLGGYQPDLARSWELRADSVLVLRLRDDARWHDGTPVTAEDVVFTIDRQGDPRTASPRQGDVAAVRSATAADSFTVEVELSRIGPYAINALLEVVPVPRHLLEDVSPQEMRQAPFGRDPVGNGFYRFVRWSAGQSVVLDANTDMPEGRPAIDRIVMRVVPDVNGALTELLTGQADVLPRLPPDQRERVDAAPDVSVHTAPRIRPAWIAFNTRRAPVDDPAVRRAVLLAVDRERLASGLFGDVGAPALSPIPAALREHSPGVEPIPYDPDRARQVLEEAGWRDADGDGIRERDGNRLRIEIDYIATEQLRQDVLVAIQDMVRRVGIQIVPRAFERTTWVDRLRGGDFVGSLWGWGWGPGVVGPNAAMVFHSRSIPPNGANFAAYDDPVVDALIDSALVERDTTRARQIWRELEQKITDDAVYAPLFLDPELFGIADRIRNVKLRGIEWWEDVPYWYIPEEERLPRDRAR